MCEAQKVRGVWVVRMVHDLGTPTIVAATKHTLAIDVPASCCSTAILS